MATLTRSGVSTSVAERPRRRSDIVMLASVLALSGFGLLMIYSATRFANERNDQISTLSMERQMVFVTAGLILLVLFSLVDYRELRNFLVPIYAATVVGLVVVFLFPEVKGARRWIDLGAFKLQPAEFSKLIGILAVAAVLSARRSTERLPWRRIFFSGVVMVPLWVLVLLEPDLGTALVLPFVWLVMVFAGGANWKQMTWIVVAGGLVVLAAFKFDFFQAHQWDRIHAWLDPQFDPQGIGFQLIQSKRAIGAGQLLGRGLFQGTQTNLAYIPEQENDFIFTAIGEQLGFVGGVLVLAAFLVVLWRLLAISANSRDRFGAMAAIGIAAMIGFHVSVNIGMTVGLAPVTGLPLPFISQGGSFYLTMAMAIGVANSIWLRRSPVPGQTFDV